MSAEQAVEFVNASEQVKINDDGTKTVTLSEPITFNNKEVTEVTFRRPRGRDWAKTDSVKGEISKGFVLAGALSGYPAKLFEDMDGDDALICSAVAGTMGKK